MAVFFVTQQQQEEESRILGVRMKSDVIDVISRYIYHPVLLIGQKDADGGKKCQKDAGVGQTRR